MDMKEIEKAVSEVMQVPIKQMHTKTRKEEVVWARQFSWKYAHETTKLSYGQMSEHYNLSRLVSYSGINRINNLIEVDARVRAIWKQIITHTPYPNDYTETIKLKPSKQELENMCNCCVQI